MNKTIKLATAIVMSFTGLNSVASQGSINADKLLTQSDLVFQGKVIEVNYKDSSDGIPHTFVTYTIEEIISGTAKDRTVTLRFMGGQQKRGEVIRYLHVSDMPDFQKGDSDVLFVRRNNSNICPLVKCSQGRYRDANGLITNDHGQPLLLTEKNTYQLSRDSMADQLGLKQRKNGLGRDTSHSDGESAIEAHSASSMIDTAGFVADLKQRALAMEQKGIRRDVTFKSSNIKLDFTSPAFAAASPKNIATEKALKKATISIPTSDFDRWEEQQVKANGGDPVL